MSVYFKKETADGKSQEEAALVLIRERKFEGLVGTGRQPWWGEEKETHDHKELIMKMESDMSRAQAINRFGREAKAEDEHKAIQKGKEEGSTKCFVGKINNSGKSSKCLMANV